MEYWEINISHQFGKYNIHPNIRGKIGKHPTNYEVKIEMSLKERDNKLMTSLSIIDIIDIPTQIQYK